MKDSKTNRAAAVDQIARFGAIEPLNDAQLVELTKTAVDHFDTRADLELAVSVWVQTRERCPRPFELIDLAHLRRSLSQRATKCDGSCDDGWIIREDRRSTIDGVRPVSVAYPCICRPPLPREAPETKSLGSKLPVSVSDMATQPRQRTVGATDSRSARATPQVHGGLGTAVHAAPS